MPTMDRSKRLQEPDPLSRGGKAHVAVLGPDPDGQGGMAAAISALVASPLVDGYVFDVIPTYGDARPLRRLVFFARSLLRLGRWCLGPGARVAHVHMAARGSMYRKAAVVLVAKGLRRPVILHVHAGPVDLEEFLRRLGSLRLAALRRCFAAADVVISVSAQSAAVLRRAVIDVEIAVVPNAPPPIAPRRPRRDGGIVRVLFLGGFANPVKGGAVLFEALGSLLAGNPQIEVVMAGPGSPPGKPPTGSQWRGWLSSSAKQEALDSADIFVIPSLSEGMPIALLEAMSNRIPVVATRVGGMAEILDDGVDAILVEPGRPEGLVSALAKLASEPDRRAKLADAGAARMSALASDDVYGQLDRIYARLASL